MTLIKNKDKSPEETTEETTEETKKKPSKAKKEPQEDKKTKKQKEADAKVEALEKEISELNDKYLRVMAEYDNFKKRTQKEKEAIYTDSVGDTVTELLPVLDNFERALASFGDDAKESEFFKGFEMIYTQTRDIFTKLGVKTIETKDSEFDPNLHNAVMHIDDEEYGENVIVEEFQKGYTYRDKVIRYSMVKVAN
ncbi:MAG: nucleotide exchange factor GrpE [Clostridia bacterium]|nr:nucleotide exchange factor GrpE [Clostridia bacterium]